MALEENLLANYERDWNEALEQYDASLRAERMANVNYNPSARIFEASQPPGSGERLQREIFGPLQAKWGPLLGTAGRSRSGGLPEHTEPRAFQTRTGIFERDPFTGEYVKKVDVPRPERSVAATPESKRDMAIFQSALRRLENARSAQLSAATQREMTAAQAEVVAAESALRDLQTPMAAASAAPPQAQPQWEVPPSSIPYGDPGNPDIFMGDPMNPVISDPAPAPLPVGPSVKRGLKVLSIRPTEGR